MKKVLVILLSLLLAFSVMACNDASEEKATETMVKETEEATEVKEEATVEVEEVKEDITITYMASQDWVMDAEIELGEKFTEETGIMIDYQIVPADQYFNLLLTKLNSGEGPDLFGGQSGKTDIVTQLNVQENAIVLNDEAWVSTFEAISADTLTVDGNLYGQMLTDNSASWAVAYNKNIFADLGISIPSTFDEFKAVCETISAAGITPVYECVSDGWHHVLWFPEIGPIFEKGEAGLAEELNANEVTFQENVNMATALNQIKEMSDLGYWGANYMSNEYANGAASIAEGSYAMMVANQGFGIEVNGLNPDIAVDDIGYFPMPLLDNTIIGVNPAGPSRFIYSGSENIDAAKQYLDFMVRDDNLQYLIENVAKFNTLPYSNATDVYNDSVKEFYASYDEKGTVYQVAVNYLNPQWMDLGKDITAIIIGDMTAEEMLKNIDMRRAEQASAVEDAAWTE